MQIKLATRGSKLALAQSGMVADALGELGAQVELVQVRTLGDDSNAPLSTLGGTGVFVAGVREAVLNGSCDLAVHSLKDLPTAPAPGLTVAAIPVREDPRDALCSRAGLGLWALPRGARVGTGSPRRAAQLRAMRWDLDVVDIRGNVDTRLARIDHDLDAVVLAAAGLHRLGRDDAITEMFDPEVMLPAPAQGALALECRTDHHQLLTLLKNLDDWPTRLAVEAERELMRLVEVGCAAPFGALARVLGDHRLELTARIADGDSVSTSSITTHVDEVGTHLTGMAHDLAPLVGMRVLMPPSQLIEALTARGAKVTAAPFTRHLPVTDPRLEASVQALTAGAYDWVALTSVRTVEALAAAGIDLAALLPSGTKVAAIGPATRAAAEAGGVSVASFPIFGAGGVALAQALPGPAGRILIPGAAEPALGIDEALAAAGWQVDRLTVYRTEAVTTVSDEVRANWPDGFDAFVATAPSVLTAALGLLSTPTPHLVVLGPTTAEAAEQAGLDVAAVAPDASASGLIEALATLREEWS